MIVTSDIANIIYKDCGTFGITEIYQSGTVPTGEVTSERIVIIPKARQPETYWKKGFVEVNLIVPNFKNGNANLIRLQELERLAEKSLNEGCGNYDGTPYYYQINNIGTEDETDLKCHFVNVRLLFNVLNTR